MALIRSVRGFTPQYGNDCFFAETSVIIGDVIMGNQCSIWYNTVLRGDVNSIRIGNRVNIQDNSVLHTLYQKSVVDIADDVSVGHNVVIHGAKICKNVLIGIGAIILDHAVIGENTIIAAGALIKDSTIVEPNSVYAGVPAKRIKEVEPGQVKEMIHKIVANYIMYAGWYRNGGDY